MFVSLQTMSQGFNLLMTFTKLNAVMEILWWSYIIYVSYSPPNLC